MPTIDLSSGGMKREIVTEKYPEAGGPRVRPVRAKAEVMFTFVGGRGEANAVPLALIEGGLADNDGVGTPYDGFDRGHLIGLSLGGPNVSANVVPMHAYTNRHGRFKAFELAVHAALVARGHDAKLRVEVEARYASPVDAIPREFLVKVADDKGVELDLGLKNKPIPNFTKDPKITELSEHEVDLFTRAEEDMARFVEQYKEAVLMEEHKADPVKLRHYLESHHLIYEYQTGVKARVNSEGWGLEVNGRRWPSPGKLPYALLDYLYLTGTLGEEIRNWGASHCEFSEAQLSWIRKYNFFRNRGWLVSDDEEDRKLFPKLNPKGALDAPEVDHIIPKVKGGSSVFSNARIISWHCNNRVARLKDPMDWLPAPTNSVDASEPLTKKRRG